MVIRMCVQEASDALKKGYFATSISGAFQLPSRTDSLGQYVRKNIMNLPFGTGNQFDSLSLSGASF